jgi:hypothetical protein
MQFSKDGDWLQVIRITGPSHNLLALKFGKIDAAGLIVERLSVSNEAPVIDAEDVERQVLEGVAEASALLGEHHHVKAIRFVTTDTPSSNIYFSLAKAIVEQLAPEGAFTDYLRA